MKPVRSENPLSAPRHEETSLLPQQMRQAFLQLVDRRVCTTTHKNTQRVSRNQLLQDQNSIFRVNPAPSP